MTAKLAFPSSAAPGPIARRVDLMRRKGPPEAHGPPRKLLLGELVSPLEPLTRPFRPPLVLPKTQQPRVVMLLPGFAAGHMVKRWGLGFNLGPTEENFALLEERVRQVRARYGQNVVLVGWSLGGIFARELAKRHPDLVAKVITMGTPFSGSLYANNVWRIYQLVTGHSIDQPPMEAQVAVKPPVETVALWSPRDGVIAPRSACGRPGERDRAVALRCTHIGFAHSMEAIRAVAAELERG
jgi:pimeloyl-ACP methyl ester carboxylesterase